MPHCSTRRIPLLRRPGRRAAVAGARAGEGSPARAAPGGAPRRAIAVADRPPKCRCRSTGRRSSSRPARSGLGVGDGARARRRSSNTSRAVARRRVIPTKLFTMFSCIDKALADVAGRRDVTRSRDAAHCRLRGMGRPRDAAAAPADAQPAKRAVLRSGVPCGDARRRATPSRTRAQKRPPRPSTAFERLAGIARDATQRDEPPGTGNQSADPRGGVSRAGRPPARASRPKRHARESVCQCRRRADAHRAVAGLQLHRDGICEAAVPRGPVRVARRSRRPSGGARRSYHRPTADVRAGSRWRRPDAPKREAAPSGRSAGSSTIPRRRCSISSTIC